MVVPEYPDVQRSIVQRHRRGASVRRRERDCVIFVEIARAASACIEADYVRRALRELRIERSRAGNGIAVNMVVASGVLCAVVIGEPDGVRRVARGVLGVARHGCESESIIVDA